jgi:hypothetical protein
MGLVASALLWYFGSYEKLYKKAKWLHFSDNKLFYCYILDCVLNHKLFATEVNIHKLRNQIGQELGENPEFQSSLQNAFQMAKNQGLEDKDVVLLSELFRFHENVKGLQVERLWRIPPMHDAVMNNNFGHWCVMSILGGMDEALNGMETSCMNLFNCKAEVFNTLENPDEIHSSPNFITKWWLDHLSEKYGQYALHKATKLRDINRFKLLLANGYDINERNEDGQTCLQVTILNHFVSCKHR